MADSTLFQPFELPNGTRLEDRLAKAAMEETLADVNNSNAPSPSQLDYTVPSALAVPDCF